MTLRTWFSKASLMHYRTASRGIMLYELEFRAKASSTKVYPLSPNEQTELDAFMRRI